jgi:hypothetical protein
MQISASAPSSWLKLVLPIWLMLKVSRSRHVIRQGLFSGVEKAVEARLMGEREVKNEMKLSRRRNWQFSDALVRRRRRAAQRHANQAALAP